MFMVVVISISERDAMIAILFELWWLRLGLKVRKTFI